jgi:hypothetical protein
MRGSNIINKYILDSKERLFSELNKEQLAHVESLADKSKYNNLRNQVIEYGGVINQKRKKNTYSQLKKRGLLHNKSMVILRP